MYLPPPLLAVKKRASMLFLFRAVSAMSPSFAREETDFPI